MKYLLRFFFFPALFIPFLSKSQDSAFTLKGNLLQPSSITSFIIFYPKMHMDSIPIQADGSFLYSDSFSEAGEMQIATRQSSIKIWLDKSFKNVYLSEKPNRNGKVVLTVDSVMGSDDTYLYYYTLLPKVLKITETEITQPRSFYSQKQMEEFEDSLKKTIRPHRDSLWRANSFREIDSIFKIRPDSKVLPLAN